MLKNCLFLALECSNRADSYLDKHTEALFFICCWGLALNSPFAALLNSLPLPTRLIQGRSERSPDAPSKPAHDVAREVALHLKKIVAKSVFCEGCFHRDWRRDIGFCSSSSSVYSGQKFTKNHGTKSPLQRPHDHSSFFESCSSILKELIADLLPLHRSFGCFGVRRMPCSFLSSVVWQVFPLIMSLIASKSISPVENVFADFTINLFQIS